MVVFTSTYTTFSRSFAEKNPHLSMAGVVFSTISTLLGGEIIFDDEFRLDSVWMDLISSLKQVSSEQCEYFIAYHTISLKRFTFRAIIN